MKYKKTITILAIIIIVLAAIACLYGIFSTGGQGARDFQSIRGETIKIFGSGLYQYESKDQRLGLMVQDWLTLALAIPLVVLALFLTWKGSIKGKLLLTGTMGYFLYTYITYSFLRVYNPMFLIYTTLMTASGFAIILCLMSFDVEKFHSYISDRMPVRFIGGYQLLLAAGLIATWLPGVIDSLVTGAIPIDLDHYSTLGYEAIDFAVMIPLLIASAILILKKKALGYLMSSIIIMLSISMNLLVAILTIFQLLDGVEMPVVIALMFPIFTLITAFCLALLLKNIRQTAK